MHRKIILGKIHQNLNSGYPWVITGFFFLLDIFIFSKFSAIITYDFYLNVLLLRKKMYPHTSPKSKLKVSQ